MYGFRPDRVVQPFLPSVNVKVSSTSVVKFRIAFLAGTTHYLKADISCLFAGRNVLAVRCLSCTYLCRGSLSIGYTGTELRAHYRAVYLAGVTGYY